MMSRIVTAAGLEPPRIKVPYRVVHAGGLVVEQLWERRETEDEPPVTSFLAEQLGTAHWFDQRETRRVLKWVPAVSLDEGLRRLQAWFQDQAAAEV
jgi:nucleoside-diphosphate-sugar epimerase